MKRSIHAILVFAATSVSAQSDSAQTHFDVAYNELQAMLEGQQPASFERSVFVSENAYLDGALAYEDFQLTLDAHQFLISQFAKANDGSDTIDFRVLIPSGPVGYNIRILDHTEEERRALYRNVMHNWAIFAHLTDTTWYGGYTHLPYTYQLADPFGMKDWRNSQVTHLLSSAERKGNCFALVALYKIMADRFQSEAYISTAPQHIYIQHRDRKGDWYNVELATGTHPGDGSIQTLTYTWIEGIRSGIALRRLKEEKQNIALCVVNLGKSYQHKFNERGASFALRCADLALKHDPLNLNAMLLRQQVLEEQLAEHAKGQGTLDITALRKEPSIAQILELLEAQVNQLNELGYHEMPGYMQEMILADLEQSGKGPLIAPNRTPSPFSSVKTTIEDERYSTLSLGRFEEVHEQKRFEVYGRVTLDTEQRAITAFEMNSAAGLMIDPVAFAWSVDPLAAKYPFYSPYAFSGNRVVDCVEWEGLEPVKEPAGKQGSSWEWVSAGTAIARQSLIDAGESLPDVRRPFRTDGKDETGKNEEMFYLQRPVLRPITTKEIEMQPRERIDKMQRVFAEGSGMFESEGSVEPNFGSFLRKYKNDITGVQVQYRGPGFEEDETSWTTDALVEYVQYSMGIDLKNVKTDKPIFTGDTSTGESYSFKVTFDYNVKSTEMVPVEVEKITVVRDYGAMPGGQ